MVSNVQGICQAADAILGQCAGLIERLDDEAYTTESKVIRGGSFGKHVRHELDHYSALLKGHDRGTTIVYDHRERGVGVETDRRAALDTIAALRGRLGGLGAEDLEAKATVQVMLSGEGDEAEAESTLAREVWFATHHAIHHHAMMKTIAQEFGVDAGPDFGKAPSTINFERASG